MLKLLTIGFCSLSLSGCLFAAGFTYLTHDVECEAMESDVRSGYATKADFQTKCQKYIENQRQQAEERLKQLQSSSPKPCSLFPDCEPEEPVQA